MADDRQHEATTEFNEALAAGFEARNFEGVGPFYTEDAVLMPPRGRFLEGREAAAAFWLGVAGRFAGIAFTTVSRKSLGDAVLRETGTYAMTPGSGQGAGVQGKYMFVWQFVDGEWQIESAIWNRNAEAGGRAGQGAGGRQGQGGGQGRGGQGGGGQGGGGQGRYRQGGGGRPSFQGGGGIGQGGGGARGGGGGPGRRQGGGAAGDGAGGAGGDGYEGSPGLYNNLKD